MFVITGEQMQEIDRFVIEEIGISGEILMERAGWWVAKKCKDVFNPKKVLICAGPGNNGGDGFVCARYLHNWGCDTKVIVFIDITKYKGESKKNLELLQKLNIPLLFFEDKEKLITFIKSFSPDVVIDAIFGTGLKREIDGFYKESIEVINHLKKSQRFKIVSIDIPSGVCASTGKIMGIALDADLTVTFETLKFGHLFYPGKEFSGKVEVVEIGFPWEVIKNKYSLPIYLDLDWAKKVLKPRTGYTYKGKFGHVLVIAGSVGKSGAGILASLGALRAGAGLVTLASPKSLQSVYMSILPEILTLGLDETTTGEVAFSSVETIIKNLNKKKAIVIGPGIGLSTQVKDFVFTLLQKINIPIVIDADALTLIAEDLEILKKCKALKVLTPHPGEAERILKIPVNKLLENPFYYAKKIAEDTQSICVFKGPHTVICEPSGRCAISSIDEPGLSQGGTGDVLAGIIASFLSQGYEPFEAVCLAVFLHGYSGKLLSKTKGPWGYIAQEIANNIPVVIKEIFSS